MWEFRSEAAIPGLHGVLDYLWSCDCSGAILIGLRASGSYGDLVLGFRVLVGLGFLWSCECLGASLSMTVRCGFSWL